MKKRMKIKRSTAPRKRSTLFCSFCGRGDEDVTHMIVGGAIKTPCTIKTGTGGGNIGFTAEGFAEFTPNICNECADLCVQILAEQTQEGAA